MYFMVVDWASEYGLSDTGLDTIAPPRSAAHAQEQAQRLA
jgi:hypothetical protein